MLPERLTGLTGRWESTYHLQDGSRIDERCPTTAVVVALLGGRFAQIDYTWSFRGTPQQGTLLLGQEPDSGAVTMIWLDSWHNGHRMMVCAGSELPDGGCDVVGTYPVGPDSPDWRWRTCVTLGHDRWSMTMYNVSPDGEEDVAVTADYRRAREEGQ